MAVTAKGFDQTLTETDWALMAQHIGALWSIESGLTMSINTTNLPRVVLNTGVVVACGVRVSVDTSETVNFAVPSSGSRWDLLALRVNWETNTAAVQIVQGGSTRALPASLQKQPGVVFDIPLLLVRLVAGENRIVDSVSLRVIAAKVFQASDELALPADMRGDAYIRAGEHWRNSGSGWVPVNTSPWSAEGDVLVGVGPWRLAGLTQTARRTAAGIVELYVEARTQTAQAFNSLGSMIDNHIATISYAWARPSVDQITVGEYVADGDHTMTAGVRVDSVGRIFVVDGRPNTAISAQSSIRSFRLGLSYLGGPIQ